MTYKSSRRALEAARQYVEELHIVPEWLRGMTGDAFLAGWREARYQFVEGFLMGAGLVLLIVAGAALAVRGWG
jgi:uncharacterized membrane protein